MQTFLPYPDFKKSLQALDYRRLGKQRVEAYQIIHAIKFGGGYSRHPVVRMWHGHINALKHYYNLAIDEWVKRGYINNMHKMKISGKIAYPRWFGRDEFSCRPSLQYAAQGLLLLQSIRLAGKTGLAVSLEIKYR